MAPLSPHSTFPLLPVSWNLVSPSLSIRDLRFQAKEVDHSRNITELTGLKGKLQNLGSGSTGTSDSAGSRSRNPCTALEGSTTGIHIALTVFSGFVLFRSESELQGSQIGFGF